MHVLKVEGLSKVYGDYQAVNQVSFSLQQNSCIALLGPNGAGKTTTLKMLAGQIKQTKGKIAFPGIDEREDHRKLIGYLPQYPTFYQWMTGREFLEYVGKLALMNKKDIKDRTTELLIQVGLEDAGNKRISSYSGGMKQRLGIAQAMIHRPKLLMLDEPVSALDPFGRREVLEMIKALKRETTVLFSSHILNDAEEISDEILILHKGKLVEAGTQLELKQKYTQAVINLSIYGNAKKWIDTWQNWDFVEKIEFQGAQAKIVLKDIEYGKKRILQTVIDQGIPLERFEVGRMSLEDLFMKVVEA